MGLQAMLPACHCVVDCRSGAPLSTANCTAHDVQSVLPSPSERSVRYKNPGHICGEVLLNIVYNIARSRAATYTAASKRRCSRCVQPAGSITHVGHAEQSSQCLQYVQAFYLPATKHPWWWLGIRSIDKKSFGDLLKANNSVVLVPGGVSECMIMKHGQPTLTGNQHALLPLLVFCSGHASTSTNCTGMIRAVRLDKIAALYAASS